MARQYAGAIDVIDAADPHARCACFTAAYGRSPVRSGSYLATSGGLRRFSPQEILRLLGFPASFRLDLRLTREQAWRLVGNSLSVMAVTHVLSAIPGLDKPRPWSVRST
jgi:site-specific DNA-cytosine methylase